MLKKRFYALVLIIISALLGYFVYNTQVNLSKYNFKLGLDLNGGTELIYKADMSGVDKSTIGDSMDALRDVIERRVNMFGVSEPSVRSEKVSLAGGDSENRLLVELPGITDIDEAIAMIGETPELEFRLLSKDAESMSQEELASTSKDILFEKTGLTGRLLEKSSLVFDQTTGDVMVSLQFTKEGNELFAKITRENIGRVLAIFLDGDIKSLPTIREEIANGGAVISGGFVGQEGIKEAKKLVNNLNLGALPVPIELISTQSVGASLGEEAIGKSLNAGLYAFIIIAIFLIVWYRLPGLLATIALIIYVIINLALFKLIPVTLTSAGIAGFILSIGMAVDANILIFERMKEELNSGRGISDAVKEGFARAWTSIRDSNISSIITALILFFFSSTSVVKGFALVFLIGVLVSMFSAITASRTLLFAINNDKASGFMRFLFGTGLRK